MRLEEQASSRATTIAVRIWIGRAVGVLCVLAIVFVGGFARAKDIEGLSVHAAVWQGVGAVVFALVVGTFVLLVTPAEVRLRRAEQRSASHARLREMPEAELQATIERCRLQEQNAKSERARVSWRNAADAAENELGSRRGSSPQVPPCSGCGKAEEDR
jgi:hypothetical protein